MFVNIFVDKCISTKTHIPLVFDPEGESKMWFPENKTAVLQKFYFTFESCLPMKEGRPSCLMMVDVTKSSKSFTAYISEYLTALHAQKSTGKQSWERTEPTISSHTVAVFHFQS